MKQADKNSRRSKRRVNSGFKTLELSSRKHKRNLARQMESRTLSNTVYPLGEKVDPPLGGKLKTFMHNTGGANRYH